MKRGRARWTVGVWIETPSDLTHEEVAEEVKRLYRRPSLSPLELLTVYTPRVDAISQTGTEGSTDAKRDAV